MPKRPKFHKIISERTNVAGNTEFTLQYDPALFADAKCKNLDTELFFPPKDRFSLDEERYISNRLCGGCKVREACLEWGLVHERHGIWGGLTAYRRNILRRSLGWAFKDIALQSTQR